MKSYASVDRIEKNFAVCEVEMIGIEKSKPDDFDKTTQIINILIKESIKNYLSQNGIQYSDFGTKSEDSVDWRGREGQPFDEKSPPGSSCASPQEQRPEDQRPEILRSRLERPENVRAAEL